MKNLLYSFVIGFLSMVIVQVLGGPIWAGFIVGALLAGSVVAIREARR